MPTLYLIPCGIGSANPKGDLPSATLDVICNLKHFIVERAKTARAFLKSIDYPHHFDNIEILELDKHAEHQDYERLFHALEKGSSIGVISEAGAPGVADPGAELVEEAHKRGINVSPLIGPSSILLALMASGMNGQQFEFHGYLPRDEKELKLAIKQIEAESYAKSKTQLFIETPYRNDRMFQFLLKNLNGNTLLCIASNISCEDEEIITMPVKSWSGKRHEIGKKPTVFLIFSGRK